MILGLGFELIENLDTGFSTTSFLTILVVYPEERHIVPSLVTI